MPDRIQYDSGLREEFCLTKVLGRTENSLRAEAVFHEDIQDPGDAAMMQLQLERTGDTTTLTFWSTVEGPISPPARYRLKRR